MFVYNHRPPPRPHFEMGSRMLPKLDLNCGTQSSLLPQSPKHLGLQIPTRPAFNGKYLSTVALHISFFFFFFHSKICLGAWFSMYHSCPFIRGFYGFPFFDSVTVYLTAWTFPTQCHLQWRCSLNPTSLPMRRSLSGPMAGVLSPRVWVLGLTILGTPEFSLVDAPPLCRRVPRVL